MKLRKNDYFSELYISQNSIVSRDIIEEKYNLIKRDEKKKEKQIYDESIRVKSAIQKVEQLNKLDARVSKIEHAYEYCSDSKNILLRNAIIALNTDNNIDDIKVSEKYDEGIKNSLVMKKTKRDGDYIESSDFKLLELEKYELMNGIEKLETSLKRYKLYTLAGWEHLNCDFYTDGIDLEKMQTDIRYRQTVLRAIEIANMKTFEKDEPMKCNYIGKIEVDEEGNYSISISERIKEAVELKNNNLLIKRNIDVEHNSPDVQR